MNGKSKKRNIKLTKTCFFLRKRKQSISFTFHSSPLRLLKSLYPSSFFLFRRIQEISINAWMEPLFIQVLLILFSLFSDFFPLFGIFSHYSIFIPIQFFLFYFFQFKLFFKKNLIFYFFLNIFLF